MKVSFRPLPGLTVATVIGLAVLIALGTWQLQRRTWKNDLITRIEARASAPAVDLPPADTWASFDMDDWEYRRVHMRGTFDHDAEAYVFTTLSEPRGSRGGPGYWVITPLRLDTGGVVLVNRGFVPHELREPESRAEGLAAGPQKVVGLIRRSEEPGLITPAPDRDDDVWFVRDLSGIAAERGLDRPAPFLIDAETTAPGGFPQGGETRLAFRNEHLGYALTWYGLAVVLLLVYFAFHTSRGRLSIGGRS